MHKFILKIHLFFARRHANFHQIFLLKICIYSPVAICYNIMYRENKEERV